MSVNALEKLKSKLLTKDQALVKIAPFEGLSEMVVGGRVNFDFHSKLSDHFIMEYQKKEYVVTLPGFTKLCRLVGIPATYVRKIPHQLLFPHLSYWLNDGGVEVKAFFRSKVDEDGREAISGFAKADAYYYPISQTLKQVDKVCSDYLIEGLEEITWRDTTFGLVFPQFEFPVQDVEVGDILYGGIKIRNSMLSEFPLKISAFLLTLACMNGMVSVDEVYTFNRKLGFEGQDEWIVDGVQQAFGALAAEVEKVRRLTTISLSPDALTPYLVHIFDQTGLNQKTREAVLLQVAEKRPKNLYQLLNAITAAGHVIENRGEVYSVQSLGGFLASHAESCPKCHRPY